MTRAAFEKEMRQRVSFGRGGEVERIAETRAQVVFDGRGLVVGGGRLCRDLPRQRLTSHPSIKTKLESSTLNDACQKRQCHPYILLIVGFDYCEDPVVVSNNLITRCVSSFSCLSLPLTLPCLSIDMQPWPR